MSLREALTEDLERCERHARGYEESGETALEAYYNGASDALRRALEHLGVPEAPEGYEATVVSPDGGYEVTVTRGLRKQRGREVERFAYVINRPGWWTSESSYRYRSAESAMQHGMADVTELKAALAEGETNLRPAPS